VIPAGTNTPARLASHYLQQIPSEHASWAMALLTRLDQALGPGVLERSILALDEDHRGQVQPLDSGTA
jgi:hypothetical protein